MRTELRSPQGFAHLEEPEELFFHTLCAKNEELTGRRRSLPHSSQGKTHYESAMWNPELHSGRSAIRDTCVPSEGSTGQ